MPNAFDRHEPNLPPGARDVLATIRLHGWSYAPDSPQNVKLKMVGRV